MIFDNVAKYMEHLRNNFAFIDSQNLNLAIRDLGWVLDQRKFRIYLRDKYGVSKAFLFIGYVHENQPLYTGLQDVGFILIFKSLLRYKDGKVKGNVDAEMVLQTMIELNSFDKAVIVTGDGDFHCLIKYLVRMNKLEQLLVPNRNSYSALLKKAAGSKIAFMNDLIGKLEYKKNPRRTEP